MNEISLELKQSLSEVLEALRKISSGDPTVRIEEASRIEIIRELQHMVNVTAINIGEIVDQSHEFAITLAEHFETLHKVSNGDLKARISSEYQVELLESLKKVTNKMLDNISGEISQRMRIEETLKENESRYRTIAEKAEKSKVAFLNMLEDIHESYKELEDLFLNLVSTIVNALDAKSPWTKGHSVRVAKYAEDIAKEMGLSEKEIQDLHLAGLLHDIGKIGTYDILLDKPGKLTNEEFEIVKKHPVQGAKILQKIKQLKNIIPIIRHHHERIDGRGYPDGLKGEEIPLSARILHVADSYDSMTADRPYRAAPGKEYAISELKRCSGTQFEPYVVDTFLRVLDKMYE